MKYAWLIGPSASGKSTLSKLFNRTVISDEDFIWKMARKKRKIKGGYMIEDEHVDWNAREAVIKKALNIGECVIECAVGNDELGIRNMSFDSLLAQIDLLDDDMIDESVFIYLKCPFPKRQKRNVMRKETRILPEEVFNRFHRRSDFYKTIKKHDINYLILKT